jgi:Ser/Thr protein kinase RdoA (MazF antagonist)
MRGSLGEKVSQGGTADIYVWAPGQVIKLFTKGFPLALSRQEARMTQAVFAAGAPAPEVFGEVTLDGRFGIVLGRLDGPTLLQATRGGAVTFAEAGAILASLGLAVHRMPPPAGASRLRGWMEHEIRLSGDLTPKPIASAVLDLIDRLQQPGDGLCHGDIHPGNVIMTANGPRLIDWTFSIRAPAAFDHGSTHISLTEFALDVTDNPRRPLAVNAAAQSEYARMSGEPVAALRQTMKMWLPVAIVRYFLLMGGPTSERWRRMMQRAETALRLHDEPSPTRKREPGSTMSDETSAAALYQALARHYGVDLPSSRGRGFGSGALKVDGKIFASLSHGRLLIKLPADRVRALVEANHGEPFSTGPGRIKKEWITVAPSGLEEWLDLADESKRYVSSKAR